MKKLTPFSMQVLLTVYLLISLPVQAFGSDVRSGPRGPKSIEAGIEAGCRRPHQGPTGPTGPTGHTGAVGATGPQGVAISFISAFADGTSGPTGTPPLFGPNGSLNSQFVFMGAPIYFNPYTTPNNPDPFAPASDIIYDPPSGTFLVSSPGIYEISYGGRWVGTMLPDFADSTVYVPVVGLRIGLYEIPDSRIASQGSEMLNVTLPVSPTGSTRSISEWISSSIIISITEPSIQQIALINSSTSSVTTLQLLDLANLFYPLLSPPPTPTSTAAFITIKRIQ
jgi:hypothetical protein